MALAFRERSDESCQRVNELETPTKVRLELPQRLRRNRVLSMVLYIAVLTTICFFFFSRTRVYRIYHHRSALRVLAHYFKPQPATWRDYLSPAFAYWWINRNLDGLDRMERANYHINELIELGYLERREFNSVEPIDISKGTLAQMSPFITGLMEGESTVTWTANQVIVTAPAKDMPRWVQAMQMFQAGQAQAPTITNATPPVPPQAAP